MLGMISSFFRRPSLLPLQSGDLRGRPAVRKRLSARYLGLISGISIFGFVLLALLFVLFYSFEPDHPSLPHHALYRRSPLSSTSTSPSSSFSSFSRLNLSDYHHVMARYDPLNSALEIENYTVYSTVYAPESYQRQPYVANGHIGLRLPAPGFGFSQSSELSGWPLDSPRYTGAFVAGFYNWQAELPRTNYPDVAAKGGESVLASLPVWADLRITCPVCNVSLNSETPPEEISGYSQSVSFQDGVVETKFDWSPCRGFGGDDPVYRITVAVYTHGEILPLGAVRLEVDTTAPLAVADVLDMATSVRSEPVALWRSISADGAALGAKVRPSGLSTEVAHAVVYTESRVVQPEGGDTRWCPWEGASNFTAIGASFTASGSFTLEKYAGVASSDGFGDPNATAVTAVATAHETGWENLRHSHSASWNATFASGDVIVHVEPPTERSEDTNSDEDADAEANEGNNCASLDAFADAADLQLAARASLFHLLANSGDGRLPAGLGDNSVPVAGLSGDAYAGFIFWDADTWMFPPLLALHPPRALPIMRYRARMLPQAQQNAEEYGLPGALYPWTSSRFGNCTGSGPCVDYQYHLNADIGLAAWQYYMATNDTEWLNEAARPILENVAEMFAEYVTWDAEEGGFGTVNLTDPDEYANNVDNGVYTNAAIAAVLRAAIRAQDVNDVDDVADVADVAEETRWNIWRLEDVVQYLSGKDDNDRFRHSSPNHTAQWRYIAENMLFPTTSDGSVLLQYDGMNGSAPIKQADTVLLDYPLEHKFISENPDISATQLRHNTLDYYAQQQSPDGPAMAHAMYTVASAAQNRSDCASATYWLAAYQPYIRHPFYQFSEQTDDNPETNGGTRPAFPFLTGHGGFLQTFTHGFTGFRWREHGAELAPAWPAGAAGPRGVTGYTLRGLKVQGAVLDVRVGRDGFQVEFMREEKPETAVTLKVPTGCIGGESGAAEGGAGGTEVAQWERRVLRLGDVLEGPVRRGGELAPHSASTCTGAEAFGEGHGAAVAAAINDGNNYTYWETSGNGTSRFAVRVDLEATLLRAVLVWGAKPPQQVSIGYTCGAMAATTDTLEALGGQKVCWVTEQQAVEISSPYRPEDYVEPQLRDGNYTVVQFEAPGVKPELHKGAMIVEITGAYEDRARVAEVQFDKI